MLLADACIFLNLLWKDDVKGTTSLAAISLGISIPMVLFIAAFFSRHMERQPVLVMYGTLPLGFIGGLMVANDPFLRPWLPHGNSYRFMCGVIGAFLILCAALWLSRWRKGPEGITGP
jgi:predicted tellurium resistance membrane protein TerC